MLCRIALLFTLAIALVACNRDNFSAQQNPDGGVDITVTATESEVNTMLSTALAQGNGQVRDASVDLQSGQIIVSGEVEREEGSGNFVPANFTVALALVDGQIDAQVTEVNVAGWSADDSRITAINQRIENALSGRARRDNPSVTLTSVSITDTDLTFVLNAQRAND